MKRTCNLTARAAALLLAGWVLVVPQTATANSEYARHVACNEAWRASPAATQQQCTPRGVKWDSFLWSLQTSHRFDLQKTMEHSKCWVDVYCDAGTPLFPQGAHRASIKYTEVRKLRRCQSNPAVMNSQCDPLTMEEVHRVAQSTSGNHHLTVANVTVTEGGTATVRLKLSEPVEYAIRYRYFTRAGTAQPGDDYKHASGTVSISPNRWGASVRVKTHSDPAAEDDEHFFLDFKSLSTLGRQPGTWTWVYDPGAGLPQNLSARVRVKNKVDTPQSNNAGSGCLRTIGGRC